MSAASANGIQLRGAQDADLDGLLELESLFPSDRMSRRSFRRFIRSPNARVIVAKRGGTIIANLVLLLRNGSDAARIYSIVVGPDARGLGLGSQLVEAALEETCKAGRSRVSLEVRADNAAALALYAKLGFREVKSLPAYYDDGADGQRLECDLAEPARR